MIIKLTEKPGGLWNLWAEEGNGGDGPVEMVAAARKRTPAQLAALLAVLTADTPYWAATAKPEAPAAPRKGSESATAKRAALKAMLGALDGWIEGARSNHEQMGHRDKECCLVFYPSDIRNMVNDAAREVGLNEFPLPQEDPK